MDKVAREYYQTMPYALRGFCSVRGCPQRIDDECGACGVRLCREHFLEHCGKPCDMSWSVPVAQGEAK